MNLSVSLIDLAETDSRASDSPSLGARTPTPSPAPFIWPDSRYGVHAGSNSDLHAALNNIPKSFSSQLNQFAQYSSLPQYSGLMAFPPLSGFQAKERSSYQRERDPKPYEKQLPLETSYNLYSVPTVSNISHASSSTFTNNLQQSSKYSQLLAVIEELGKDIRPTYAGSKSSAERLKRGIVHARILVREALIETERSARQ